MALQVLVKGATNLPAKDRGGTSDPYAKIIYSGKTSRTKTIKKELNPTWNETFTFEVKAPVPGDAALQIRVYDKDMIGKDEHLGQLDLKLKDIKRQGCSVEGKYPLVDEFGKPSNGSILLSVQFDDPEKDLGGEEGDADAADGADAVDVEEDLGDEMDGEEGGGGGGDGGDMAATEADGVAGKPRSRFFRRKRAAAARRAAERKQRRDDMISKFPDKELDFQVRVHVIEARRLVSKVQPLDPVANVFVGSHSRQSRVIQDSDKPFWDEMFFFELKMKPSQVFDQVMRIQVDHSRTFRKDARIGSFELDLGTIYVENDHAFIHKWLLLTNPLVDAHDAKGFLKVSLVVLGPGDPAVRFPQLVMDDQVDIEANLLRPVGAQLQPGVLQVKVFRAEDVPRMDVGFLSGLKSLFTRKKEDIDLVDPYVEISFAGKKGRTEYHKENANPKFNEKINLGIRIPSMCDKIRVRLIDRDAGLGSINKDDIVGTGYIPLSQISVPGEGGFLPQFGPSYMNLYGAPRKFDVTDEYDYLNEGKMEGAAYRGRVLLEISTTLGTMKGMEHVEPLTADEMVQVVPYLRRRKFVVHAVFFDATMVSEKEGTAEFEVSIGNYGNQLDGASMPQPSSTEPSTPVYNGNHYCYVSWNKAKPCCSLTCQWEDMTYRLECLSIISNTCDHLAAGVERVTKLLDFEATTKNCASAVIQVLNTFLNDLAPQNTIRPPNPDAKTTTKLDVKMYEVRRDVMATLLSEAAELRDNATDVREAVEKCADYLNRLKALLFEAQNDVPDVVIWMLSSKKRIAYARIPAYQLFFSERPLACGKLCGQHATIYLKYHGKKGVSSKNLELPAQLRVKMWFGLAEHESSWNQSHGNGSMAVFAETYENQSKFFSKWKDAVGRPNWSDSLGKISMPREDFAEPEGWTWEGFWDSVPPNSYTGDKDAGEVTFFEDDVFEYQTRAPATNWSRYESQYGDVQGNVNDDFKSLDSIELPPGWEWVDGEWQVDINRAVDEEGWEYTVDDAFAGYNPSERVYHLTRRRRWMRGRRKASDEADSEKVQLKQSEMFEYARVFRSEAKYHFKPRTFDLARRRLWKRKLVAGPRAGPALFEFKHKNDVFIESPRVTLVFDEPYTYELRAYLYQARNIRSGDDSGTSDAYCRVSFQRRSMQTRVVPESVMPTWDETLIFEHLHLFEDPQQLLKNPPEVVIEIFDKDTIARDDFLGRVCVPVSVYANAGAQPALQWHTITYMNEDHGEILACFHLIATSENPAIKMQKLSRPTQTSEKKYIVPSGIAPEKQRYRIEVLTWGVRDMKRFQALTVTNPAVQLECNGIVKTTEPLDDVRKNPNYGQTTLKFESIYLPRKRIYCPPLNIRVIDHRSFGRKPVVGLFCVGDLNSYHPPTDDDDHPKELMSTPSQRRDPAKVRTAGAVATTDVPVTIVDEIDPDKKGEEQFDWWSKYYASLNDDSVALKVADYAKYYNDRIMIYDTCLEEVADFDKLADFLNTFPLTRGKTGREKVAGIFKGAIKIAPLPENEVDGPPPAPLFGKVPSSSPVPMTVRVYVVKGIDLTPKDDNGKNDAYVIVRLGKEKYDSRDHYVPNSVNPTFGCFFELKGMLPMDHQLKIEVKDYDLLSADDLIGETAIDLENRYLTKHQATCGIPEDYYVDGVNKWRDVRLPSEILAAVCERFSYPTPNYSVAGQVSIGARTFALPKSAVDGTEGRRKEPSPAAQSLTESVDAEPISTSKRSLISGAVNAVKSSFKLSGKGKMSDEKAKRLRIRRYLGSEKERLAVSALRGLDAAALVPEHVETRPLFNPMRPGVEQGRLQLWVDMFVDPTAALPPPVDISNRKPKEYVLRCVVWNTEEVILDESNLFGEEMSDIYVSGWLRGIDEKQKTDVHYRSLNGEGNFNWRFVFPFQYYPTEQCLSVTKKEHFWSLDETERRLPPVLVMQVWDNDIFNPDDYLGDIELNLNDMLGYTRTSKSCALEQMPEFNDGEPREGTFNLFESKRVRGWWPMKGKLNKPPEKKGTIGLAGKIELELEILTKEEAEERPAGRARDDPNANPKLDPPNRPDTSFFWFTSPWKSCKYIIWRRLKWLILAVLLIGIVVAFLVLFFYNFPGYSVRKLVIGS